MGADAAGLAMAALTVCAAALPDRAKFQVKKHNPRWKESARLGTALVGSVGKLRAGLVHIDGGRGRLAGAGVRSES
jgi:hypothetical protein